MVHFFKEARLQILGTPSSTEFIMDDRYYFFDPTSRCRGNRRNRQAHKKMAPGTPNQRSVAQNPLGRKLCRGAPFWRALFEGHRRAQGRKQASHRNSHAKSTTGSL